MGAAGVEAASVLLVLGAIVVVVLVEASGVGAAAWLDG